MLDFAFGSLNLRLRAFRQDTPPLLVSIAYDLMVDTGEPPRRLRSSHTNLRKHGTTSSALDLPMALVEACRAGTSLPVPKAPGE